MVFHVREKFGIQIEEIWRDKRFESIDIKGRGFAVQDDIKQNALMFVGINPSYDGIPGCTFYDNSSGKIHKYFTKFQDISLCVGLDWTHLDMLFIRETSQNVIKALANSQIGHDFIDEQLRISKKILELAKPQILIVNNTYARDLLFADSFLTTRYEFEFDEVLGTERIINHDILSGTPVFFTSMLTGQRALDLGSYRRLVWHIKYVKKLIENKN